jgi:hypothetical protein
MRHPIAVNLAIAGLALCAFGAAGFVPLAEGQMGLLGVGSYLLGLVTRRPGDSSPESAKLPKPHPSEQDTPRFNPPNIPPVVLGLLLLSGCVKFHEIDWPAFAECGEPAVDLLADVLKVLLDEAENGEGLTEAGRRKMANLATKYGAEAVVCALVVAQQQGQPAAAEYLEAMGVDGP